jgi:hypothetical protein
MRSSRVAFALITLLLANAFALPVSAASRTYTVNLSGAQEVADPPVDTLAHGSAIFKVAKDGESIEYRVIVRTIENVTQAHIHLAPAGQNGAVVAWLYPSGPPAQLIPGTVNGVLITGTITDGNLVGPLAGESLSELIAAFASGNAYVNVHTSQFPAGEIRGQI